MINEFKTNKNQREISFWKMNHGKASVMSEASHQWLIDNGYIAMGYEPEHSQRKKFEKMQNGDIFYLLRNAKVVLLGEIDGSEIKNTPEDLKLGKVMRKFKKISLPIKEITSTDIPKGQGWTPQYQSTVDLVNQNALSDFEKTILQPAFGRNLGDLPYSEEKHFDTKISIQEHKKTLAKNRVLYGPPGTGKTFNTINKALEVVDPSFDLNRQREEVKNHFDKKLKEKQIFFTTFHQSMSYEDFIEGIKPVLDQGVEDQADIAYKIEDGLFKQACALAAYNCYKKDKVSVLKAKAYSFDSLFEQFINYLKNTNAVFKSKSGRDIEVKRINSNGSIIAAAKDSVVGNIAPITQANLQKLYEIFESIDQISNLNQVRDVVGIGPRTAEFYAVFKGLKEFEKNWFKQHQADADEPDDLVTILQKYNDGAFDDAIRKHGEVADCVVLIIDEINRGNVSQIFGELITLIEDDKRLGMSEELLAQLPYSKSTFGVPANLYIIGTMNTADRSVEALDTALRRRFSFEEKLPDSSLIANEGKLKESKGVFTLNDQQIALPLLLDTINSRIARLLDKDHQIGHSYFMSINDEASLLNAFKDKIIPLLQEYFFGDYDKIGLVLGNQFVEKVSLKQDFATFAGYVKSDFDDWISCNIKDINLDNIFAAVQSITANTLQDAT